MPAAKPKDQQRVILNVTCSVEQKALVEEAYKKSGFPTRSKFLLHKIYEAIAQNNDYVPAKIDKHATKAPIQISCTPKQKESILQFTSKLPSFKRSRWILGLVIQQ